MTLLLDKASAYSLKLKIHLSDTAILFSRLLFYSISDSLYSSIYGCFELIWSREGWQWRDGMSVGAGLQVCSQSGYTGLSCLVSRLLESLRICLCLLFQYLHRWVWIWLYFITASLVSASGQCCSLYLRMTWFILCLYCAYCILHIYTGGGKLHVCCHGCPGTDWLIHWSHTEIKCTSFILL